MTLKCYINNLFLMYNTNMHSADSVLNMKFACNYYYNLGMTGDFKLTVSSFLLLSSVSSFQSVKSTYYKLFSVHTFRSCDECGRK